MLFRSILEWKPQFLLDSHEMGAMDTYLFNPPRAPFNPFLPKTIYKWWDNIAKDQAAAFDEYGWSYYTRDWNEEVYPGYGSSWGIYIGLVGILYEQSGADGSIVKKEDGTSTTYRETVHHQFISSMANLTTIANHREELLQDYYDSRKKAVSAKNTGKAFVFSSESNTSRLDALAETLKRQTIEIYKNKKELKLPKATTSTGDQVTRQNIPAGSLIVPMNQPLNLLINNILSFDIRLDTKSMEKERKKLMKDQGSTLYDVTAWSLSHAYGTESYYTEVMPKIPMIPYKSDRKEGKLIGKNPKYGWAIKSNDDQFYHILARLLENGVKIWCAEETFNVEDEFFPRGSVIIRNNANQGLDKGLLKKLAFDTKTREASNLDQISFWNEEAKKLSWFDQWTKTLEWNIPFAKWFVGGKINASYNTLDVHQTSIAKKPAIIWEGENGATRTITYARSEEHTSELQSQ